jgi:fido (protein-threonine AMPylation protein)
LKERAADILAERLKDVALLRVDQLTALIEQEHSPELLRATLRESMWTLSALARASTPEEEETASLWETVMKKYEDLTRLKRSAAGDMKQAYQGVFEEYSSFIEDDLYAKVRSIRMKRKEVVSEEDLMTELYGRSVEEVQEIKDRNRKNVAAFIEAHRDEAPSIALLERLHRENNKGLIPADISKVRKQGEEVVYGGGRVGTFGEDVREELEHLMAKAEWTAEHTKSSVLFQCAVAKLHNDMLNIHPFKDRNGSTSMLFIEFMTAKRGYTPSPQREDQYYTYVRKALSNNPVAVGILGGGQYEIGMRSGYYKGFTAKGKEKKYEDYFSFLNAFYAEGG